MQGAENEFTRVAGGGVGWRWWWQFSFWLLFPIISGVKPRRQGGGKVVEEHAPVKGKLRRRF